MKITHYLYNAFVIEWDDKKIAIDPGALFAYYFSFATLIPKSEWPGISHVFVTHGDPDHYWHADRLVKASGAPVILNESMVKQVNGDILLLGPRSKGISFDTSFEKHHILNVNKSIEIDGMTITGLEAQHGPLKIKAGPFEKTLYPGPEERIGWGSIGFEIRYKERTIVNLGDTKLLLNAWKHIQSPDVLMLPIGGRSVENTMNEDEALEAVELIKPKVVIPMHYDCPMLFSRKGNPANDIRFKILVEAMGIHCEILHKGESLNL